VLYWCAEMETLFVGLDSGAIHSFTIPKEHNYMRYQEVILAKMKFCRMI
jgi:hypothetical protein